MQYYIKYAAILKYSYSSKLLLTRCQKIKMIELGFDIASYWGSLN